MGLWFIKGMFLILHKQTLAPDVKRLDILAPAIARKFRPGQFVSVCPEEGGERIPLTIIDADGQKGSIALIFREVGETTRKLGAFSIKESVFSILGPLGAASCIEKKGEVVCLATGVGIAQMLPLCRALKSAGNKITGIIGAKTRQDLILDTQMRLSCDKFYTAVEDGAYERRKATDVFLKIIQERTINCVYAVGSVEMMKEVCHLTKTKGIATRVILNSMMVDCLGMCGSCRVTVAGRCVLACIDGPEFDGHQVDFQDLMVRMKAYKEAEQWHSPKLPYSQKKSESGILTKFLSGILNE